MQTPATHPEPTQAGPASTTAVDGGRSFGADSGPVCAVPNTGAPDALPPDSLPAFTRAKHHRRSAVSRWGDPFELSLFASLTPASISEGHAAAVSLEARSGALVCYFPKVSAADCRWMARALLQAAADADALTAIQYGPKRAAELAAGGAS